MGTVVCVATMRFWQWEKPKKSSQKSEAERVKSLDLWAGGSSVREQWKYLLLGQSSMHYWTTIGHFTSFHCQYIGIVWIQRGMRPESRLWKHTQYADAECACTSVCEVHEDWDAERKRLKTRIRQAVKVVPECVFNRRVHYASLYCGRSPRHGDDHSTRLVWLESSADLLVSHKFANRRRRCRRIVRQAQRYLESISLAMCTSTINPRRTSLRSRALWMNAKCRQILPI